MALDVANRLVSAALRGLGRPGQGTDKRKAAAETERLEQLGVMGVGIHSTDEDIERWEDQLWHDQDDLVEEQSKEWRQNLHYVANRQYIAWHREARRWIPKKMVPWRIRSIYNVLQKAVSVRVSRLTENKPTVAVVAATTDREDVEKAEYKETLFWYLWNALDLHRKVTLARRWATKCASGFLQVGWDPEAGPEYPVTRKRVRWKQQPVTDPATGQPVTGPDGAPQMEQVYDGIEEFYVDRAGQPLGPVETIEEDPDEPGKTRKVRQPVPPEADTYHEGMPFVDVESGFNVRFDKYTDDVAESWYVQKAKIMPATRILSAFPDAVEILREARPASEDDKAIQWSGLSLRSTSSEIGGPMIERSAARLGDRQEEGVLDKEYLYRETWIYPVDRLTRRLWGKEGALLITVGGKLVEKRALPKWAVEARNFIQFVDMPEEGNHYGKSTLRDLIPIQDDINRSRSQMAERAAILSRLIVGAPQGHQMNLQVLGGMPGVLMTYRSAQHKPESISLGSGQTGAEEFYRSSLEAVTDLGNMNDASTGKLPSAGIAAKAIYALQYADERSISETSNLQDIALKRLAEALDAVTRHEFTEERKIRIVGEDRSFMTEHEIRPELLRCDVDYVFVPGSMMSRQKEAIRNEMLALLEKGLVEPWEVRKYISSAVPDAFRRSNDLQEAAIRRKLQEVLRGGAREIQPDPWEDPSIAVAVLEEFMLTAKWKVVTEAERQAIAQAWQAYQQMRAMRQQPAQPQPAPGGGGQMPTEGALGPAEGAAAMAAEAEAAVAPPESFGQPAGAA